jgi:two-component system, NarL family, invasion response regulator UvrY
MENKKQKIKVALVDDHALFRRGLANLISLIDNENRYTVLFEAANGTELIEKLKKGNLPDILLLDIEMPDMNGFEAAAWIRKYHPDISILVVSMVDSEEAIIRMLRMGISGYLSKDIEPEDIYAALQAINSKGFYFSDFITRKLVEGFQTNNATEVKPDNLTENERIFLRLACSELTYQQIAEKMSLSPKTIDGYRENLFHKFKVKSRVGLAMYAVRNGFVNLT